jgi:hypothetical protein
MYDLNKTDCLISKVLQYKKLHPPFYHEYNFKYPEHGLIKRVFIKYPNVIGMLYEDCMLTNKNTNIANYLYRSNQQLLLIRENRNARIRENRKARILKNREALMRIKNNNNNH